MVHVAVQRALPATSKSFDAHFDWTRLAHDVNQTVGDGSDATIVNMKGI
jgi:hypothetical protein